jgi:hypothetical protein
MKQYIRQITNQNFVYPNYVAKEYDVDIIHELNEYSVSGYVTNISATTISSTGITFNLSYTWIKNNTEVFIKNSGRLSILSVHLLAPGQNYYKAWRIVQTQDTATTNINSLTASTSFTVTPSMLGLTVFTTGTYSFEVRFIGHRSIFPVCYDLNVTI